MISSNPAAAASAQTSASIAAEISFSEKSSEVKITALARMESACAFETAEVIKSSFFDAGLFCLVNDETASDAYVRYPSRPVRTTVIPVYLPSE